MQPILTDVRGVGLSVTDAPNDPGLALLRRVPCAWGHSVQPSPNTLGLLFYFDDDIGYCAITNYHTRLLQCHNYIGGVVVRMSGLATRGRGFRSWSRDCRFFLR